MATILTPTYSEPFSAPLPPPSTGEWEYWPFWTAASGFVVKNYPGLSLSGNTLSGTPESCGKIFTLLGSGVLDATQVALTSTWAFALTPSGSVVRWAHGLAAPYENRGWWYKHWNVIPGLSNVAKISAGGNHLFYIKNDTSLGYWAPDGSDLHNNSVPSWVGNETGFVEVATDQSISIARKSDGTVKAFGWDDPPPDSIRNYDLSSITNAISVTCNNYEDGRVLTGAILTDSGDIYSVGVAGPSLWKNIPNAKKIVLSQFINSYLTDGLLTLKTDGTVEFTILPGEGSSTSPGWNLPADFSLSNFVNLTDIYGGGNEFSFLGKKSDGTIVSSLGSFNPGPTGNGGFTQVALSRNLSPLNWVGVKNGKVSTAQTDELQRNTLQFIPPNDFLEIEIDGAPAAPVIVPNQVLKYSPGFSSGGFYFKLESDLATDFGDKYCAKASSWSASGLPNWLTLNSANGVMTGTIPIEPGIYSFELTAINETGSDTKVVSFESVSNTPIITSGQTFTGNVGNAFSASVSLSGSQPATAWAATGIPSGLSINTSTGAITGTPTTKGSFTASVTATGSGGTSPAVSVSFTIAEGAPIITSGQTGSGKVGEAFSKTFSLTDSTNRPVTSWSATGLPSWASITSSSGQITGTPQDSGSTTITITATGPGGTDTETATISIAIGVPLITAGQTFTGKVGDAFSANIALDDALDRPATAWAATALPAGLSINSSTGAITGSPTSIGSFTASIAASNGAGSGASQGVGFTISAGKPLITPNQTLSGTVGLAFSASIALTNSANRPANGYTFTGLPAWAATNSSSGVIAGTPTTAGTTTFSVTATGPGGTSEPTNVSLVISTSNGGGGGGTTPTTMQLPTSQSFTATVGSSFSATPQVLSGEPVSWYATSLPDWASIDSATGQITGTPTFTGTHYISLTAVDENSLTATGVFILTTVSWNTLELYVDPKGRKMLSKANTRSVLSKMTLKRDDRTPFTIVFVSDTTTFSVPADYNISVGIKQTYGGEYLAYADADSGILDLSTDPVQELFADEPDQIDALLEIKWEDAATAAIRTITLPLQIQNSVIRGNLSGGGSVVGPIASGGNSLAPYLTARQIVLTGEQAEETTLSISENLVGPTLFHRPEIGNMPARKGWLSGVSNVTITNEVEGSPVTTPLTAGQDFEFFADRQCFYFTNPETTEDFAITGSASRNSIQFGVSISGTLATPASFTTTHIDTASPSFEVTGISVESEDAGSEMIEGFYFDKATSSVFFHTALTASSISATFQTNLGDTIALTLPAITDSATVAVPKNLWPNISEVTVNGVVAYPATYSLGGNILTFSPAITASSLIVVSGPAAHYTAFSFTGSTLTLPTSLEAVIETTAYNPEVGGVSWGSEFNPFAVLEKTSLATDTLHLGWNYPTGVSDGLFTIDAEDNGTTYQFQFYWWPGNAFELPTFLDNVHTLALDGAAKLVVFEPATQKLLFSASQSGRITYSATHKDYEGLAKGGETLEIVEEIPGIYATTCGTGHYVSTLRTLNPSQDWYQWWVDNEDRALVQIVDDQNIVIYQDESENAFQKARPGYTALDLKPLTLKLPLAALWGLARRDDTSFFQEAFSPDFAPMAFSSATYPALDDSQRYAADSMAPGKSVTLSTNQSAPVRGVQGVTIVGPSPTYFAGSTIPYITLSTYKWFVVKCTNPAGNSALTSGKKYLLCANNVQLDSKSIMVNITNQGYNIAADLYEIRRAI